MIIRFSAGLASAALLLSLLAPVPAMAKGVVLNFSDVDIATMVKFISDLTGKNFVMDERVKGKISVYSPSKLSSDEAFNVFTSVLELKGFTIVPAGRVYKIIPTSQAKQSGMKLLTEKDRGPVSDAYVARIIPLERISAQEAVTFLQPIVSKDGYIAAFGANNMLMVVDSALNIQKLTGILAQVDSLQKREGTETVFLKNASAESVATVIREWLGGKGSRPAAAGQGGQQTTSAAGVLVIPDNRLNALVISGNDRDKEDIKKLVALIDVVPPTSSSKINVYYLENADATEVGKVLDGIIKGVPLPGQQGGAPATAPAQSPFEGGKISVTPDKATNSLVIMASPVDYQNLLQVIQKLDKRRRQVFVQAVIAEVSLDKAKELGLQLAVSGGGTAGNTAEAGVFDPFNFVGGASPQQAAILNVLTGFAGSSNLQLGGVLKALISNGAVNVLSTPNILTSDNKEAEIFVGENVPFLTQTNLTSTGLSQQSIERKDTGITLRITPQISEGEFVKLDIYQEISAVKDSVGQAKDLVTTKRSAKTAVVVKDKDTVVIGGLIQDRDTETINKIPILGDIPLLGWFFKTKSARREKTNLMIVLTPRIIRGAQEMAEVSNLQKGTFDNAVRMDIPFSLDREELKTKQ
ncbi:general secretion pathway protein D [Geobacter metallireducens RCH3]|uniref:Type II secretion system protein GspD, putative n=1 Tax=Geobacter metallireducens (strain ATCC 53774 / DSM 7210 / GS-15) TaxID=269799 RepID=Q39Q98_GEOMG|nr:type II secretion system secretin GspD [Geobacter metallireducens]ABB33576.1 type II secretion system protein GspD, putative [Geobacter metallireducens GS-15]EHP87686.1 general secretion pathway protein D [Geobacter metallireducens RCH3]